MAKLVAIGDSLVQGAMSLAVDDTRLSFPSFVANGMGLTQEEFQTPNFTGAGGLPFNLEWMARNLEQRFGYQIDFFEWLGVLYHIACMLDDVEDYWERGKGARPVSDKLYHNLGVFGFQVCDSYLTTPKWCDSTIGRDKDEWFQPPSYGWLRIARRVFNPQHLEERQSDSQLDTVMRIKQRDGDIENLIVCLGANNCLNTVYKLKIVETGFDSPGSDSHYTLWSKEAFRKEYEIVGKRIAEIAPTHVYLSTVPYVTTMPLIKGIMADGGGLPADREYFDSYIRMWLPDERFNPKRDLHLSGLEAQKIDERVDEYNLIIKEIADRHGWHVVDLCQLTKSLDYYRNHGRPTLELPSPIDDLDSRFLMIDKMGRRVQGGLISLDGMHPTTCGYGLFAQAFIEEMRKTGQIVQDVDFEQIRRMDTLVSCPPRTLHDIRGMMEIMEERFHLSRWMRLSIDKGIQIC